MPQKMVIQKKFTNFQKNLPVKCTKYLGIVLNNQFSFNARIGMLT